MGETVQEGGSQDLATDEGRMEAEAWESRHLPSQHRPRRPHTRITKHHETVSNSTTHIQNVQGAPKPLLPSPWRALSSV